MTSNTGFSVHILNFCQVLCISVFCTYSTCSIYFPPVSIFGNQNTGRSEFNIIFQHEILQSLTYIFTCKSYQPPSHVEWILTTLKHSSKPVKGSIFIWASHRLMQGRDAIVMFFSCLEWVRRNIQSYLEEIKWDTFETIEYILPSHSR